MDYFSDYFKNSPSLNESNNDSLPPDKLYDNAFEFDSFEKNGDDNLLSGFPFGNKEMNIFDDAYSPIQHIESSNWNIPNEAKTTAFATQMPANPEFMSKKTSRIFEIKKQKHKGRRKKNIIYVKKAKHPKSETKNILNKNKKGAYNKFLAFFNKDIKESKDEEIKKRKIKLRKVSNSIIGVCSQTDNLELIKMKMKDILSGPLANNHKKFDKNYNKKAIDFILRRKDKKLISSLNKSFEDVIREYADDLVDKDFDGFKTIEDKDHLKDDPNLELEEMEYNKTYIKCAKNYKQTWEGINKRSSKKKKNN